MVNRKENSKNKSIKPISKEEIEKIILDLAEKGMTSEKIGLILAKQYGIKNVKEKTGKRIGEILKKHNKFVDPDIINLEKRVEKIKKHLSQHKHDYTAKRALSIKVGKLNKLIRYREK